MPNPRPGFHARRRQLAVVPLLSLLSLAAVSARCLAQAAKASGPPADSALTRSLDRILGKPAVHQGGFWGVYVYSQSRRRVLFDHHGENWFTPASNGKLFTLAAALHLIGADYRFHTVLESDRAPSPDGVIRGDVVLVGSGDPSLAGRAYPYRYVPPPLPGAAPQPAVAPYDTHAVAQRLAQLLVARGVKRVAGDIVGDDSYYANEPYPPGWSMDDKIWGYGAPVSALTMNDNERFLLVDPGAAVGRPAHLRVDPALNAPLLINRTVTAPKGTATDIEIEPDPQSRALIVTGPIAVAGSGDVEEVAVLHPALFAAAMLRQALVESGIEVDGVARARHRRETVPSPVETAPRFQLGELTSPPLSQIVQVTAKVSQNLEAELMLRLLGKLRGATAPAVPGTVDGIAARPVPGEPRVENEREAGERVLQAFLHQAGLGPQEVFMLDGSGLSRYDLVEPAGIVHLLVYMAAQPEAATWEGLLPIAAVDGTLDDRFRGTPAAGRIHAKTGSLSHDYTLSGYVTTRGGDHRVFSLMVNNNARPSHASHSGLDAMGVAITIYK